MKVLFRTDANKQIGLGHFMRCFALAQALGDRGDSSCFLMVEPMPTCLERLTLENLPWVLVMPALHETAEVAQVAHVAKEFGATHVVVDGYQFGRHYQDALKQAGLSVLLLDDYGHADYYSADWVLNQNITASEALYPSREPETQLLLGTDYTLLRREFSAYSSFHRIVKPVAQNILVTLGGGDSENVTTKVVQALEHIHQPTLSVSVAAGKTSKMAERMAWADMAIAAGGSTNWELAFMGLPALVIEIAENQSAIAQKLAEHGVVENLGWHAEVTPAGIVERLLPLLYDANRRQQMRQLGQQLVDGQGCQRVLAAMQQMCVS